MGLTADSPAPEQKIWNKATRELLVVIYRRREDFRVLSSFEKDSTTTMPPRELIDALE